MQKYSSKLKSTQTQRWATAHWFTF